MIRKPLNGCTIKVVDASRETDFDAAAPVRLCLARLGAIVPKSFVKHLTHVVVVQRAAGAVAESVHVIKTIDKNLNEACPGKEVQIVSQLWAHDCESSGSRLPEADYILHPSDTVLLPKKRKRAKSGVPAQLDVLDLNNAIFSSTQAMASDMPVPSPPRAARRKLRAKRRVGKPTNSPGTAASPTSSPVRSRLRSATHTAPPRTVAGASTPPRSSSPASNSSRSSSPELPQGTRNGACAHEQTATEADAAASPASQPASLHMGAAEQRATPAPVSCAPLPVWGSASPRRQKTRPAPINALPNHLTDAFVFPAAPKVSRTACGAVSDGAACISPKGEGSAAERARARARAAGGNPEVIFERLVTRAGMQMPIVLNVPIDGTQLQPAAERQGQEAEHPIPVPVIRDVDPVSPPGRTRVPRTTSSMPPLPLALAESLSIGDVNSHELAVALGAWTDDARPWDGLLRSAMEVQFRAQEGTSVWREPVLQAAALLRQQAGTPAQHDDDEADASGQSSDLVVPDSDNEQGDGMDACTSLSLLTPGTTPASARRTRRNTLARAPDGTPSSSGRRRGGAAHALRPPQEAIGSAAARDPFETAAAPASQPAGAGRFRLADLLPSFLRRSADTRSHTAAPTAATCRPKAASERGQQLSPAQADRTPRSLSRLLADGPSRSGVRRPASASRKMAVDGCAGDDGTATRADRPRSSRAVVENGGADGAALPKRRRTGTSVPAAAAAPRSCARELASLASAGVELPQSRRRARSANKQPAEEQARPPQSSRAKSAAAVPSVQRARPAAAAKGKRSASVAGRRTGKHANTAAPPAKQSSKPSGAAMVLASLESDSDFETATPVVRRRPAAVATKPALKAIAVKQDRTRAPALARDASEQPSTPTGRVRATRSSLGVIHLACSSASAATFKLARSLVAALGRATLCETEADVLRQPPTHLVVCGDTRSSKCLLAAAAGADLVTPQWLQACSAEGSWLPAAAFSIQGPLAEAAALAAAWRVQPETAPFHNMPVHVAPAPGADGVARGKVVSALVQRLGGSLVAATKCDVCVLCSAAAQRARGNGSSAKLSAVRCRAGAAVVADTWVTEAVAAASRPDFEAHALALDRKRSVVK